MIEKIKELLIRGIDAEKLQRELSLHFTENLEDKLEKDQPLRDYLTTQPTLEAFFQEAAGTVSDDDTDLIEDLYADLDYGIMNAFDLVEDSVKDEMLHGHMASEIRKDLAEHGIVTIRPSQELTEDLVEEAYLEAFQDFDALRVSLTEQILKLSPEDFFNMGKESRQAFRKSRGLTMDELDFNRHYLETFDKERLFQLFAVKIYESITYHSRYVLESVSEEGEDDEDMSILNAFADLDEDADPEDVQEALNALAPEEDSVLVADGDLSPEDFTFVYELLTEYNGHRVLPSEEGWNQEAYWETFGDEFAELLGMYMIDHLEETIRYFSEQRPDDYATLSRLYGWSKETAKDPQVVLTTCEKISFFLADLQERLWDEFSEEKLQPLYEEGLNILNSKEKDS
ncbi:MAG: hypothetical protein J6P72_00645 [Firmicutes bacterium]|nr:hypothetical protein [Bacillota bacterium]